jgi:hypothetical protein
MSNRLSAGYFMIDDFLNSVYRGPARKAKYNGNALNIFGLSLKKAKREFYYIWLQKNS